MNHSIRGSFVYDRRNFTSITKPPRKQIAIKMAEEEKFFEENSPPKDFKQKADEIQKFIEFHKERKCINDVT